MDKDLKITLGVEEEFFLVDPNTRDLVADPDPGILAVCEKNSGPHKVVTEFLRSSNRDQHPRLHIDSRSPHSTDGDPPDSH